MPLGFWTLPEKVLKGEAGAPNHHLPEGLLPELAALDSSVAPLGSEIY